MRIPAAQNAKPIRQGYGHRLIDGGNPGYGARVRAEPLKRPPSNLLQTNGEGICKMRHAIKATILALAVVLSGSLMGCMTFTQMTLQHKLDQADQAFDGNHYGEAATLYESLRDRFRRFPYHDQHEWIFIRQGKSLYQMADYHDAAGLFEAYLRDYPDGDYRSEAEAHLGKIDVFIESGTPAEQAALVAAQEDLDQLQALRIAHPHDPAVAYALGSLYYGMGAYEVGARYYMAAAMLDAAYEERYLIKERLLINAEGKPVPVTPYTVGKQDLDKNPLVVYDAHVYHSGDRHASVLSSPKLQLNMTGLVRNQGSDPLKQVQVEVRFMSGLHQVIDVKVIGVGTLSPSEVRAFRAHTTTYDNISNILEVHCTPRWRR
jgi:tetratricopeptide (TPR) repeat protein